MNGRADFDARSFDLGDEGIDIQYYLSLLLTVARKYLIWALPLALVTGGFAYYKAQSAVPTYTATVVMHVAPKNATAFNMSTLYYGTDTAFQSTQIGILGSKLLMRRVVEALDLHRQDSRPPPRPGPLQSLVGRVLPSAQEAADAEPQEAAGSPEPAADDEMDAAAEAQLIDAYAGMLGGAVVASPESQQSNYSNLVNISVTWSDSESAARIANTVAEQYMKLIFEKEVEQSISGQQYLNERLAGLREDLRLAEAELQAFLDERDIDEAEIDQQQELTTMSGALLDARSERLRLEGILEQLEQAGSNLDSVPAIANHPRVIKVRNTLFDINQRRSELSRRYGPRHNSMLAIESEADAARQALADEVREVVSSLRAELALARNNEASLEASLGQARNRQQTTSSEEFRIFDLQQDIEVKRGLLVAFTEMLNTSDATGPEENTNVWIVDPASPPGAANLPSTGRYVGIAVVLSIMAVMGVGVLLETWRNTLATPEELEKQLSIPPLGTLPLLKDADARHDKMPLDEYMQHPSSYFSETIRSLRTSLVLKYGTEGANRFVITSTEAHEGKSSVALSLAVAYAKLKRTLIIDCDLRRPSLERVLTPQQHHRAGLTDLLAGGVEIDDVLVDDERTGVTFLPAGSRTLNPLEVLSSPAFGLLLSRLNERFEVIVFDTPPCLAVSDAYLVSTQGDAVIVVIKAGATRVPNVRNVVRRFADLEVDVAGAILNQVDMDGSFYTSAYGSYRMYRDYGPGDDEASGKDPGKDSGQVAVG